MWIITMGIVPFIIGLAGQTSRRIVLGKDKLTKAEIAKLEGWRKWYYLTFTWHALFVGFLVGLIGFYLGIPVPALFGTELGGSLVAYTFSGGVSIIAYDTIVKTIQRVISVYQPPAQVSTMLPPPPDESPDGDSEDK